MPTDNQISPQDPALQAPQMSLEAITASCFTSANDPQLAQQFRAMNWRLWVIAGHLRVIAARQLGLSAQMRQRPPTQADAGLAKRVESLDAEFAGFLKLFGPEISQKMSAKQTPAAAAATPAEASSGTAPPAAPADVAVPIDPAAAALQTALAGKAEDLAGAKIVQVVKPKGKRP